MVNRKINVLVYGLETCALSRDQTTDGTLLWVTSVANLETAAIMHRHESAMAQLAKIQGQSVA